MSSATKLPPQAPVSGRLRQWLGAFHYTGLFWYRFPAWGVRVLPKWGVGVFVGFFTPIYFLILGQVRRAIASNLEVVLGPCGWWRRQRRTFRTFWNFAWCLTERYERLATERTLQSTTEGEEHWRETLGSGEGFILLTAHIGHWEVGSMTASSAGARQVHVVREEEINPEAQEFLRELFRQSGEMHYQVHFEKGDPSLGVRMLQALRRGEVVAMQGDRPTAAAKAMAGELFGQPIDLPPGPVTLARAAGVRLQPVFAYRAGRLRTRVIFPPAVTVGQSADRARDMAEAVATLSREIEAAIQRDPYQWFCFRELWPATRRRS